MSTTLIGFTLISIAVCASPGPSMFYVLSSGLTGNKRIAMASVLGITHCKCGMGCLECKWFGCTNIPIAYRL
ncbi:MAG: hypothetical protein MI892_02370 [Desulfobacterales bacterium]|nr:hypothetical protein [Desulfobacterales bacterium]